MYTFDEMLNDLRHGVFTEIYGSGPLKIDIYRRGLQRAYLAGCRQQDQSAGGWAAAAGGRGGGGGGGRGGAAPANNTGEIKSMLRGELKQLDAEIALAREAGDRRCDEAASRRCASADQSHPEAGGGRRAAAPSADETDGNFTLDQVDLLVRVESERAVRTSKVPGQSARALFWYLPSVCPRHATDVEYSALLTCSDDAADATSKFDPSRMTWKRWAFTGRVVCGGDRHFGVLHSPLVARGQRDRAAAARASAGDRRGHDRDPHALVEDHVERQGGEHRAQLRDGASHDARRRLWGVDHACALRR